MMSGSECVDRLLALGFTLQRRMSRLSLLRRGDRLVIVPLVAVVEPHMLEAILRSAGLPAWQFAGDPPSTRRRRPSRNLERDGAPSHR